MGYRRLADPQAPSEACLPSPPPGVVERRSSAPPAPDRSHRVLAPFSPHRRRTAQVGIGRQVSGVRGGFARHLETRNLAPNASDPFGRYTDLCNTILSYAMLSYAMLRAPVHGPRSTGDAVRRANRRRRKKAGSRSPAARASTHSARPTAA